MLSPSSCRQQERRNASRHMPADTAHVRSAFGVFEHHRSKCPEPESWRNSYPASPGATAGSMNARWQASPSRRRSCQLRSLVTYHAGYRRHQVNVPIDRLPPRRSELENRTCRHACGWSRSPAGFEIVLRLTRRFRIVATSTFRCPPDVAHGTGFANSADGRYAFRRHVPDSIHAWNPATPANEKLTKRQTSTSRTCGLMYRPTDNAGVAVRPA